MFVFIHVKYLYHEQGICDIVNVCVYVCMYVEDSMTVTMKYNIKGITQVIIFIIIPCIIIIYSRNKHQHDLNIISIHTLFL